jgi:hypothetical protein
MYDNQYLLRFKAATGFDVVLEFGGDKEMKEIEKRITDAGLECEQPEKFNPKFDTADLYVDMRSPVCTATFDLEDWLEEED